MEAESRLRHQFTHVAAIASILLLATVAEAANYRTQNFIVQAPTQELATAVGDAAEKYRNDLAVYWLGKPLRPWPAPCPVRVDAGPTLAAQGVTTYNPAPVRDFQMEVVGTPERILDSVLPHEVTHTVLATHFGRPLPRWADEGICTTVEHDSERNKHEAKLREFLRSRRGIPMNQLFLLTEYPNDVLPMYAQGYSVCQFLIGQKGPRAFINFLHDYISHPSWTANVRKHYEYESLAELQSYWVDWVSAGSGPVARFAKVQQRDPSSAPINSLAADSPAAAPIDRIASVSATEMIKTPEPQVISASAQEPDPTSVGAAVGTVSALASSKAIGTASSTPIGQTALASLGSRPATRGDSSAQGWYQRQKSESGSAQSEMANSAIRPLVPPSVRQSGRYQSAQPQEEGGISKSGTPVERISGEYNSDSRRFQ
jgi:hypothetical protein